MRVTFLCLEWPNSGHVGGVGRYAYRLAEEMSKRIDLTVITFEGGKVIDGVDMIFLRRPDSRFARFYLTPLVLGARARALRSDVIHSFGDDWALNRLGAAPVVRTFLGSALNEARASHGLRKLNHYSLAVTEWWAKMCADYKIGIGPESFEMFSCDRIMPPVVPSTLKPTLEKTDEPSVIFIGSYYGRKRGEMAENAVRIASNELGRPVGLTVIGPENDAAHWSAATDHVSGASDQEVADRIASAWLLVAPSRYEGFGIPIFEALNLGTRVVASPNPGSEYIRTLTGQSGVLTTVSDEAFLRSVTDKLREGPLLTATEALAANEAVALLLHAAAPERLMNDVYPEVQRKRH